MVLLHLFFICLLAFPQAEKSRRITTVEWPMDFSQYVTRRGDQVLYAATNAVFEGLNEIDFSFPFNSRVKLGINVERKVYETREITNTWIVEDHFKLRVPVSFEAQQALDYALGQAGLTAGLVITPGIEWIHFRKTKPSQYRSIPTLKDQKESLESSSWYQGLSGGKPETEPEIAAAQEHQKYFWDPSVRPRFAKILHPLTIPFRLPYHSQHLQHLKDEEVFVYSATGTVETSLGVSAPLLKMLPGVTIDAGTKVRAYFGGEYRVAILKESSRFAKVRVAWIPKRGRGVTAGVSSVGKVEVANWLGLGLDYNPKVIPFQVVDDRIISRLTDWSFRYDLHDPKARHAFDQAVWGLLAESQELADEQMKLPESERSLSLLSHLEIKQDRKENLAISRLEFLIEATRRKSLVFSDIDATLPDGFHEILKWESAHQKQLKVWGGAKKETVRFTYTLLLDYLTLALQQPNAYALIAEGFIEDFYTSGEELNAAIHQVEAILGDPEFLREFPEQLQVPHKDKIRSTLFGRSSFYFGYNLTQSQVDDLLNVEPKRMKELLFQKFKKKKQARSAYRHWLKAHRAFDIRERLEQLAQMLDVKSRDNELMQVFQEILDGQIIDVFVNLYAHPIGRVDQRKHALVSVDKMRVNSEPGINIEQQVLRFSGDPLASFYGLKVTSLEEVKALLSVYFSKKPKQIFFRIQKSGTFTFSSPTVEFILDNTSERFHEGENSISIDAFSDDALSRILGQGLTANNHYSLSIAYSIDGKKWGPLSTTRFFMKR